MAKKVTKRRPAKTRPSGPLSRAAMQSNSRTSKGSGGARAGTCRKVRGSARRKRETRREVKAAVLRPPSR